MGVKRVPSLPLFLPQAVTTVPRMSTLTTKKGPVYPVVSLAGDPATRQHSSLVWVAYVPSLSSPRNSFLDPLPQDTDTLAQTVS